MSTLNDHLTMVLSSPWHQPLMHPGTRAPRVQNKIRHGPPIHGPALMNSPIFGKHPLRTVAPPVLTVKGPGGIMGGYMPKLTALKTFWLCPLYPPTQLMGLRRSTLSFRFIAFLGTPSPRIVQGPMSQLPAGEALRHLYWPLLPLHTHLQLSCAFSSLLVVVHELSCCCAGLRLMFTYPSSGLFRHCAEKLFCCNCLHDLLQHFVFLQPPLREFPNAGCQLPVQFINVLRHTP